MEELQSQLWCSCSCKVNYDAVVLYVVYAVKTFIYVDMWLCA